MLSERARENVQRQKRRLRARVGESPIIGLNEITSTAPYPLIALPGNCKDWLGVAVATVDEIGRAQLDVDGGRSGILLAQHVALLLFARSDLEPTTNAIMVRWLVAGLDVLQDGSVSARRTGRPPENVGRKLNFKEIAVCAGLALEAAGASANRANSRVAKAGSKPYSRVFGSGRALSSKTVENWRNDWFRPRHRRGELSRFEELQVERIKGLAGNPLRISMHADSLVLALRDFT